MARVMPATRKRVRATLVHWILASAALASPGITLANPARQVHARKVVASEVTAGSEARMGCKSGLEGEGDLGPQGALGTTAGNAPATPLERLDKGPRAGEEADSATCADSLLGTDDNWDA